MKSESKYDSLLDRFIAFVEDQENFTKAIEEGIRLQMNKEIARNDFFEGRLKKSE